MDIPAIAAAGVDKAWAVAASALTTVTLRDGPTFTNNTVTDVESVSVWAATVTLDALLYEQKEEERDLSFAGRTKMALIRRSDCPTITELSTKAELVEGADVWHVHRAETPPGGAIFILTLRR